MRIERALLSLLAALALLSACSPYTSQQTAVIQQQAMVRAPTGPSTGGTVLDDGELALEASAFGTPVSDGESRAEGESGHIIFDKGLELRFSAAHDRLEFGVGSSMAHSDLATPAASDIHRDSIRTALSLSVDPHLRVSLVDSPRVSLYGLAKARGTIIGYTRRVHYSKKTTYYEDYNPYNDTYDWRTYEKEGVEQETHRKLVLFPAAGIGANFKLSRHLVFSLGAFGQQAPVFFGQKIVSEYCHNPTGGVGAESCEGEAPDDVDAFERTLIATGFSSLSLELGDTTIRLQGFFNGASPSNWPEQTPFGARLAVRQSF